MRIVATGRASGLMMRPRMVILPPLLLIEVISMRRYNVRYGERRVPMLAW
jgi:hypothetical protein